MKDFEIGICMCDTNLIVERGERRRESKHEMHLIEKLALLFNFWTDNLPKKNEQEMMIFLISVSSLRNPPYINDH